MDKIPEDVDVNIQTFMALMVVKLRPSFLVLVTRGSLASN